MICRESACTGDNFKYNFVFYNFTAIDDNDFSLLFAFSTSLKMNQNFQNEPTFSTFYVGFPAQY